MMIRPKSELPVEDAEILDNADLDAIALDAAAIEGEGAPGASQAALPGMGNAENIQGALAMAKLMLGPVFAWWPEFDQVWSDGQIQGISGAAGLVCDKHGWNFGEAIGQYGPYLALVAATAPPVIATVSAVKAAKRAAAEAERREREGRPAPAAAA